MRSGVAQALESIWYGRSAKRWLLWPAALAFRGAARLRSGAYRAGLAKSVELPVPVVVVGNISVGGTGKTPFIIWLAGRLRERGVEAGIVSRGYRGRAGTWPRWVEADADAAEVGDEPVLLAQRTGCPVAVGPDRVAAARFLLAKVRVDVILSDDGLQHLRMRRAFEIAIVDGRRGLGNGMCLPAGPLREPPSRLDTVDTVVVNEDGAGAGARDAEARDAAAGDARRGEAGFHARLRRPPIRMRMEATHVRRLVDGAVAPLSDFAGRRVHAVAGIGHPERFFGLLERAGIDVVRHPLADHAEIRPADLRYDTAAPVLITEKDAVKCRDVAHDAVWAVAVDAVLDERDGAALLEQVRKTLRKG